MINIALRLDSDNAATDEAAFITIYGPTWTDRHPYSKALHEDLQHFNWKVWRDEIGNICASAAFLRVDPMRLA